MSEEGIIEYIKIKLEHIIPEYTETLVDGKPYRIENLQLETNWTKRTAEKVQGLLDLYNKEKEKNRILEDLLQGKLYELYLYYKDLAGSYQANSISKDKIKQRIKELEKQDKEIRFSKNYLIIPVLNELLEEVK